VIIEHIKFVNSLPFSFHIEALDTDTSSEDPSLSCVEGNNVIERNNSSCPKATSLQCSTYENIVRQQELMPMNLFALDAQSWKLYYVRTQRLRVTPGITSFDLFSRFFFSVKPDITRKHLTIKSRPNNQLTLCIVSLLPYPIKQTISKYE
jgi:hypothetical protein